MNQRFLYNISSVSTDFDGIKTFKYHPTITDQPERFLMLFEIRYHQTFSHWVFESAVFLREFKQLKLVYPNLNILVNRNPHRSYKKLFFDLFGILESDIMYLNNIEDDSVDYTSIPPNSACIIMENFTQNSIAPDVERTKNLYTQFYNDIQCIMNCTVHKQISYSSQKKCDLQEPFKFKKIKNLWLPRNTIENYKANDRNPDYTRIKQILRLKSHVVYDTILTKNFLEQIKILTDSEEIYLDLGGSLYVNGFFCVNSVINVIGGTPNESYPLLNLIIDLIKSRGNTIKIVV
jgi:hypothetical protein